MIIAIGTISIKQSDVPPRNASCWAIEAVIDAHLQSADVEVVEVAVQCCIPVLCYKMPVVVLLESEAEEISNVTKDDKDEVGYVGGEEKIVRRFIHQRFREISTLVHRGIPMVL